MRTLLVDYGEVVSQPQPSETVSSIAALLGLKVHEFTQRYWEHRPAYDLGAQARTYWSQVRGSELTDDHLLEQLVRLDIASWGELNSETVAVLARAQREGASLSLLSNAPHELAAALSSEPALEIFEHLIFSSQLGLTKPDPAAYHAALKILCRRPGDVLFIDDRPENVTAALNAGLHAVRFTSAAALAASLGLEHGRRPSRQ